MKRSKKKSLLSSLGLILMVMIFLLWILALFVSTAKAEEENSQTSLFVLADQLNGRLRPTKKAPVESLWEEGDELHATGKWSKSHEWVEVEAGEVPTVWVYYTYVTEQLTSFTAYNTRYDSVKIRSKPIDGRVRGYLKKGKSIEITQVVLGWGKCSSGWIDLSFLVEEEIEP